MSEFDIQAFPALLLAPVLEAGRTARRIAREPVTAVTKSDGSPVTRADWESHTLLVTALEALRTGWPIVSEESCEGASCPSELAESAMDTPYWCVDPLDGTKEFLKKNGEYTINVALIRAGRPVLGLVYAPEPDVLWAAAAGAGAWRLPDAGASTLDSDFRKGTRRRPEGAESLAPGSRPADNRPLTAVISRSHAAPETLENLRSTGFAEVVRRGSSVKMCAVAEGSADLYPRFGPTCYWDTAAGTAVAREAGCRVVAPDGSDLSYALQPTLKHPAFLVLNPQRVEPDIGARLRRA